MNQLFTRIIITLMFMPSASFGYMVGPPVSLDKLVGDADVIFKGTCISGQTVTDDWFKPIQGFGVQETQFKLISMIKGKAFNDYPRFHHYDYSPKAHGRRYMPQMYHFEPGVSYIVFGKRTALNHLRQLWLSHTGKPDQGVFRCADSTPANGTTVKEAVWFELVHSLRDASATNVMYAIQQLDQMSRGGQTHRFDSTQDFDRNEVLTLVHDYISHTNSVIALAAIAVIGSHNPYFTDERAPHWLATVGSAEAPGLAKMDRQMQNPGGRKYWRDLVALADNAASIETRAAAIRALGLVREPLLKPSIARWTADKQPQVRAVAALLLADFPGPDATKRLTQLANDDAAIVRCYTARSIGFSQQSELAGLLGRMLKDKDAQVRQAAAMSLLSFSPKDEIIAKVFRTSLDNAEFHPLFLNALAKEHPETYRDELANAITQESNPSNWWGGTIPAFESWKILFRYLRAQSIESVRSGQFDRYLDALEQVGNYSSSEPRDIYAFYVQRGMTDRAKTFRAAAKKRVTYDLDYYFDMADKNPSLYTGN